MKKFLLNGSVSLLGLFVLQISIAQSYVPVWQDSRIKVQPVVGLKAYAFDLNEVTLLPSAFTVAMQADVNYLLKIEPDRLLADFRSHAGLAPKAVRYGGWESTGLAGHTLGHYLSAVSMHYASTGDTAFLRRANYIVDELEQCQQARKTGYIGAIPNEDSLWSQVAKGNIHSGGFDLNGSWSPWYTVHKIMGGLLDAYLYCHNTKALQINSGIADWSETILKHLSDSLIQKMLITEYGGMSDALVNTYAFTGNKKYLDLSYKFYDRRILDSLAAQIDILPGKHSNTQIPKIIGSARRYQLDGNQKDYRTATFFWETITNHHSYATGGNSNYEYLTAPDQLNDKLSDNTTETCNTYNMLKLTRELFSINPSSALMDYYEKALYNHILASQNHRTGMVTYFVSLRMGGKKEYSDEFNSFTCCVGTGMENHVKYGENIYFRGSDGSIYVNLFIPSVLHWKEKGVSVKQEHSALTHPTTLFTISTQKPAKFTLRLRKPFWAKNVSVKINGNVAVTQLDSAGYITITRQWKNNDRIEYTTAMDFYSQSMPDNANRRAIFYGPVLLAGVLGEKEPNPEDIPVFVTDDHNVNKWVDIKSGNPFLVSAKNLTKADQELKAFNQTADEHYTVYWDVFDPEQWKVQQQKYNERKKFQKELELRTIDDLRIGEMQPERDHQLLAEKSITGDEHNRKWRLAEDSGFIAFTMKIDSAAPNTLLCSYWGMDNRGRRFDIFVDDQKIASEDLNKYKISKFYEVPYLIPAELTKGKLKTTIKFVPQKNNTAGPVYSIKIIRGDVTDVIKTN